MPCTAPSGASAPSFLNIVPEDEIQALLAKCSPLLSQSPSHLSSSERILVVRIGQIPGDAGIPGVGSPERPAFMEEVIKSLYTRLDGCIQGASFPSDTISSGATLTLHFLDTPAAILARDQLLVAPNLPLEVGGKPVIVPLSNVLSESATGHLARMVITFSKLGEVAREGIAGLLLHTVGLSFLKVRSEFLATTGKASGIPAGCADTSRIIALVDKTLVDQARVSGTRHFSLWGTVGTICMVERTPSLSQPRRAPPPSGPPPAAPAPPSPSGPAPVGPPLPVPSLPSVHTTQACVAAPVAAPVATPSPGSDPASDLMDVEGGDTEIAEDLRRATAVAKEAASRAVHSPATRSVRGAKRLGSTLSTPHQQGRGKQAPPAPPPTKRPTKRGAHNRPPPPPPPPPPRPSLQISNAFDVLASDDDMDADSVRPGPMPRGGGEQRHVHLEPSLRAPGIIASQKDERSGRALRGRDTGATGGRVSGKAAGRRRGGARGNQAPPNEDVPMGEASSAPPPSPPPSPPPPPPPPSLHAQRRFGFFFFFSYRRITTASGA